MKRGTLNHPYTQLMLALVFHLTLVLPKKLVRYYGNGLTRNIERNLNKNQKFKLNIPTGPIVVCLATPHGYESKAQRGLLRYSKGDDDDNNDADYDADNLELNQIHQQDQKFVGKRKRLFELLSKIEDLESRILAMEGDNGIGKICKS